MSEIGGSEVLLLIIIGLIVLGPERLPRVANQLGSWLGQARRMTRMMRRQLEEEVNFDVNKGFLGDSKPETPPRYDAPKFVQDRHDDAPEQSDEPNLPDTYSPAHGEDEAGTGVADSKDSGDNIEAASAGAENDADAGAADRPPESAKTQSA